MLLHDQMCLLLLSMRANDGHRYRSCGHDSHHYSRPSVRIPLSEPRGRKCDAYDGKQPHGDDLNSTRHYEFLCSDGCCYRLPEETKWLLQPSANAPGRHSAPLSGPAEPRPRSPPPLYKEVHDLATGAAVSGDTALRTYPVRCVDGVVELFLDLSAARAGSGSPRQAGQSLRASRTFRRPMMYKKSGRSRRTAVTTRAIFTSSGTSRKRSCSRLSSKSTKRLPFCGST